MMCMLVCKMVWVTGFTDNLILGQAIIYKYIVYKIINFDIYIYILNNFRRTYTIS